MCILGECKRRMLIGETLCSHQQEVVAIDYVARILAGLAETNVVSLIPPNSTAYREVTGRSIEAHIDGECDSNSGLTSSVLPSELVCICLLVVLLGGARRLVLVGRLRLIRLKLLDRRLLLLLRLPNGLGCSNASLSS